MKIHRRDQLPTSSGTLIVEKAEITSDRHDGALHWQMDRANIYITCKGCNAINDISGHIIDPSGTVEPCFVCVSCSTHYFVRLNQWDGSSRMICGDCGKAILVKSASNKQGWTKGNAGCACCSIDVCPKCSKNRRS